MTPRQLLSHGLPSITALLAIFSLWDDSFFKWHPVLFIFAFLFASANAIAAMKQKRLWWIHTLLQAVALTAILYGYYVVWWMKGQFGKPHFWQPFETMVSWHAITGGITIIAFIAITIYSLLTMAPWLDKTNVRVAGKNHKFYGFFLFVLASITLFSGWYKYYNANPFKLYSFLICLIVTNWLLFNQRIKNLKSKLF